MFELNSPDPDGVLLAAAIRGETGALVALYCRHRDAARWLAERWSTSPHDIEDLVAEGFTRLLGAVPRLDPAHVSFRPYLFACIRNAAHDRARQRARTELWAQIPEPRDGPGLEDGLVSDGCPAELLHEALQALPPRWRRAVWLTAVEGLSVAEVAAREGCTPGTVAALAYRARKRLREAYLLAHPDDAGNDDCPACRFLRTQAARGVAASSAA